MGSRLALKKQMDLIYLAEKAGGDMVSFKLTAIQRELFAAGFPTVRIIDKNMQMLSAKILLDLQMCPFFGNGRAYGDSVYVRAET